MARETLDKKSPEKSHLHTDLSSTVKCKIGVKGWNFQGEMQKKWRKTEKTTKGKGKAMLNFVNIAFLRGNKSRHVRKSMRKIMCRKQSHYVL